MARSLLLSLALLLCACPDKKPSTPPTPPTQKTDALAERVRDALIKANPASTVTLINADTLEAKQGEFDLKLSLVNVRARCAADTGCAEAIATVVKNYTEMVNDTASDGGVLNLREAILPVLETRKWVEEADAEIKTKGNDANRLMHVPFLGDLEIVYVVDKPMGMRLVQGRDVKSLGMDDAQLARQAHENLARRFKQLPPFSKLDAANIWSNQTAPAYLPSLLLLPELWADLATKTQGKLLVTVPARARLFASSADTETMTALAEVSGLAHTQEEHPLSTVTFEWTSGGFKVH